VLTSNILGNLKGKQWPTGLELITSNSRGECSYDLIPEPQVDG
jgi:hypothetical protein